MIQIEFSPEEIDALEYERYHYPHPQVQRKMEVLYLKSQGLAHQDIRRVGRISEPTLTTYLRQYQEGGLHRSRNNTTRARPTPSYRMPPHWKPISRNIRQRPAPRPAKSSPS